MAVRDEGVGIPRDEQARTFDRFRRGSNIDTGVSGLGLGLYIAHQRVQAHHGQLLCESGQGKGSTFTVVMPQHDGMGDE